MTTIKENVIMDTNDLNDNNKQIMMDFLARASQDDMPENLVYAAIHQFGAGYFVANHEEINEGGITSGYQGYSYHSDTINFFKDNQADIVTWLKNRNKNNFHYDSVIDIFKDSQYVEAVSLDDMNEALYAGDHTNINHVAVQNLLAWMVGEQVCYELYHYAAENGLEITK